MLRGLGLEITLVWGKFGEFLFYVRRIRARFVRPVFVVVLLVPWVSRLVTCTERDWAEHSLINTSQFYGQFIRLWIPCRVRVDSIKEFLCVRLWYQLQCSVSASVWKQFQLYYFLLVGGHESGPISVTTKHLYFFLYLSISWTAKPHYSFHCLNLTLVYFLEGFFFRFLLLSCYFPLVLLLYFSCLCLIGSGFLSNYNKFCVNFYFCCLLSQSGCREC